MLFLLLCTGISAHAQGIEWQTLNDEVESLYRQGRYDRAVVVGKEALQIAEQAVGPDHLNVATNLENMAALYRKTGREKEADAFEKRANAIRAVKRRNQVADKALHLTDIPLPSLTAGELYGFSRTLTRDPDLSTNDGGGRNGR